MLANDRFFRVKLASWVASLGLRLDLAVTVLLHHLIMAASNRGEAFTLEKKIQKIY